MKTNENENGGPLSRRPEAPADHPPPSPDHWNWCRKCGCSVDDDMRTGSFFDGSEGTCLGCGTVYVAVALTDDSWAFHEVDLPDDEEEDASPLTPPALAACGHCGEPCDEDVHRGAECRTLCGVRQGRGRPCAEMAVTDGREP